MRVGVIGVGSMGKHHARVYSELSGVELTGIADTNKEIADHLAEKYDTKAFVNYKELLNQDIDAVSIAVPTTLHKKVTLDCMEHGVDVLIEKPIADTLENAHDIKRKAEKEDIKVMIGHILRFHPVIEKTKEMVESGSFGEVVSITAKRVGPYNPRIRDVGIITDLGVHDIDIISYLYNDEIESVYACAGSVLHSFEDHANILLKFKNGHAGSIETNWLTPHKIRLMTLVGNEGIASVDYISSSITVYNETEERDIDVEKKEPLKNELEHFVDCVKNNRNPLVAAKEGINALNIALLSIRSYKENKIIKISD
ncbi:MAG: Gfo/Idh/MocA family oxidoreductase [Euryarchaeota archaeon]|nr:Gfo/Idh/MocA family oxidoreductase [Euryarchaeota archaeon]